MNALPFFYQSAELIMFYIESLSKYLIFHNNSYLVHPEPFHSVGVRGRLGDAEAHPSNDTTEVSQIE